MIKAQDVLVLLKLVSVGPEYWSYRDLSIDLEMSVSQLHAAVKRVLDAKLALKKNNKTCPNIRNLEEFLIYAVKYIFAAKKGEITRGIATAHSAPPLNKLLTVSPGEPPFVWPDPDGETRGTSFFPIHKFAPLAAKKDKNLYQLLVLVDAIRGGRAREQEIAKKELHKQLEKYRS